MPELEYNSDCMDKDSDESEDGSENYGYPANPAYYQTRFPAHFYTHRTDSTPPTVPCDQAMHSWGMHSTTIALDRQNTINARAASAAANSAAALAAEIYGEEMSDSEESHYFFSDVGEDPEEEMEIPTGVPNTASVMKFFNTPSDCY